MEKNNKTNCFLMALSLGGGFIVLPIILGTLLTNLVNDDSALKNIGLFILTFILGLVIGRFVSTIRAVTMFILSIFIKKYRNDEKIEGNLVNHYSWVVAILSIVIFSIGNWLFAPAGAENTLMIYILFGLGYSGYLIFIAQKGIFDVEDFY